MKPRTYALALAAIVFGCFGAVAGANLYLDPEGVLGINVAPLVPNDRYLRFMDYQADPDAYNALLFGSSRSLAIPIDTLSRYLAGARVANFGVVAGTITDHWPIIEYIARTHSGRANPIRNALLVLDIDLFGTTGTNLNIQMMLAPQINGESPWRYKWRYVTAIQPEAWSVAYRRAFPNAAAQPIAARVGEGATASAFPALVGAANAQARALPPVPAPGEPLVDPTVRPDFARQLDMLQKFVDLCRRNRIDLVVALSPLRTDVAATLDEAAAAEVVRRIAAIVPVWDFGHPQWLSDMPRVGRSELLHRGGVRYDA
jgi:hypothetical protein